MNRTKLTLDVIEVPRPCPVPWETMTGSDAQRRFCSHCNRHVHDLSAMSRAEAEDLICKSAGELCVRFMRTPDGKVKTLDYERVGKGWGATRWAAVGTVLAIAAGVGNFFYSRWRQQPPPAPQQQIQYTAGAIAPIEPSNATTPH